MKKQLKYKKFEKMNTHGNSSALFKFCDFVRHNLNATTRGHFMPNQAPTRILYFDNNLIGIDGSLHSNPTGDRRRAPSKGKSSSWGTGP
jgi:hypothetical protein